MEVSTDFHAYSKDSLYESRSALQTLKCGMARVEMLLLLVVSENARQTPLYHEDCSLAGERVLNIMAGGTYNRACLVEYIANRCSSLTTEQCDDMKYALGDVWDRVVGLMRAFYDETDYNPVHRYLKSADVGKAVLTAAAYVKLIHDTESDVVIIH